MNVRNSGLIDATQMICSETGNSVFHLGVRPLRVQGQNRSLLKLLSETGLGFVSAVDGSLPVPYKDLL